MKTTGKLARAMAIILVILICAAIFAVPTYADTLNNGDFTIENGVLKKYNGSASKIIIPDNITEIGQMAFINKQSVKSIVIPNGVTKIDNYAFAECNNITNIEFPSSLLLIDIGAFLGTSISNIELPEGLTTIEERVFAGTKLSSLNIPSSVTDIGPSITSGCSNLKNFTVSPNNKNYTTIDGNLYSKDKTTLIQCSAYNGNAKYTVLSGTTKIADGALSTGSFSQVVLPDSMKILDVGIFGYSDLKELYVPTSVTDITGSFVDTTVKNLTIYGESGSAAQTYANKYGIKFSTSVLTPVTLPSFGDVVFSTTKPTNKNVVVEVPIYNGYVLQGGKSITDKITHTFTDNGSFTFILYGTNGGSISKTVTVCNIDKIKPVINVKITKAGSKQTAAVNVSDSSLLTKSVTINGKKVSWPKGNMFTVKGLYVIAATDKAGNTASYKFKVA